MKNKDMKNTALPRLRFPEFREEAGWEQKTLGEITYKTNKKNKYGINYPVYSINNTDGFLPQSDQFDGMDSNDRGYDISNYKIIDKNTFAYNPARINVGSIGYSGDLHNIIISSLYVCFKSKENIDDSFLLSFLKTSNFNSSVLKSVEGGIRSYLFYENFAKIGVQVPKKKEQKKIANCIASIDAIIETESKKLEKFKLHKNGLVQQLFPTKNEAVPKLRFSEFENKEEWMYVNGNMLFTPITNKNHNSDLPILAITQENGAIPRDEINYNVIVSDKSVESYKVVEVGDFIISLRSFQGGIEYSNYKGLCSPAYIILRKKKKTVIDSFFKHYFKTEKLIQDLNKNIEGIRDGKMVSYKQFSELLLPMPSPEEQKKIADCLTSIDELIDTQSKKVEALKEHKRGLMQDLFPNVNTKNR